MLLRQSPHLVRNATHNLHTPRTYDSISLGQLAAGPLYMARDGATKFGTPTREVGEKKQKIQKKTTALRVYSSIIIILYNFFCALFIASPHKSTYGEPYYGVLLVKQLRIKMGKAQGWMRRG